MSIDAMRTCWGPDFPAEAKKIRPQTVRLVALAVADVVNDMHDNRFYASRKTLAKKIGCHPDTVGDVMRHLVQAGAMERIKSDPGRPVEYRWLLGASPSEGCGHSPQGVRSSTVGGAVTSPHHKPNRTQLNSDDGYRNYNATPLTVEEQAAKYGVEI